MYTEGEVATATLASAYVLNTWGHTAITLAYNASTVETTVTAYLNGTAGTPVVLPTTAIQETLDSDGAIGARFSSIDATKTATNHFHGFIYLALFQTKTATGTEVTAMVNSSCTGGVCGSCPAAHGICLWTCTITEYRDAADGACKTCPTCNATHENSWDGCVHAANCNVCDD
jgi:hypothetical protein